MARITRILSSKSLRREDVDAHMIGPIAGGGVEPVWRASGGEKGGTVARPREGENRAVVVTNDSNHPAEFRVPDADGSIVARRGAGDRLGLVCREPRAKRDRVNDRGVLVFPDAVDKDEGCRFSVILRDRVAFLVGVGPGHFDHLEWRGLFPGCGPEKTGSAAARAIPAPSTSAGRRQKRNSISSVRVSGVIVLYFRPMMRSSESDV